MKKNVLIPIFIIALLLVGCGNKEVKTNEPPQEDEVVEEPVVMEETFAYSYPLTGIGTNEEIAQRAVAVMINNHTSARPHSAVQNADVVYEILAEGDITRFLAIYHSEKPAKIGPVRSARDYYIELAKGYNAIYAAHGYSPDAYDLIQKKYIDSINGMQYDGTLFYRSNDRKSPHNSYTSFDNIIKGATQKNYDTTTNPPSLSFLTEEESTVINGQEIKNIAVNFFANSPYNSEYVYDSESQKYKRFSKNVQSVDSDSKEEVLIDNLFIVQTKHEVIDSEGRRKIDLTSGGHAYLFQKGKLQEVQWMNKNGQIIPVLNGQEVGLVQGKTWITFVPTTPGITSIVTISN